MTFIGKLIEGVEQTAAATAQVILLISHLRCYAVGSLEAYAPDVIGKLVGILVHRIDALLAIDTVYLGGESGTDPVLLEEEHDVLYVLLLLPTLADLLDTFLAYAGHFIETFDIVLYDRNGVRAEPFDNQMGELGADALDKTAAQVLLNAVGRGWHDLLVGLHFELPAVFLVDLPVAFTKKHGSDRLV